MNYPHPMDDKAGHEISVEDNPLSPSNDLDYFLVDGSGSMMDKWWDFLAAGDVYLEAAKSNGVNSHLIVHVFDSSNIEMIQRDCPLRDAVTFDKEPLGSTFSLTPLYDAINLMGRRLKDRDPKKASILIITDGADSHSQTSVHQAKAVLDWCRARGWQVTFIGCDFNNDRQAKALGANDNNSIGVQKKLLSQATANLAAKRAQYSRDGSEISFSDTEKQQFGGYLSDQTGK